MLWPEFDVIAPTSTAAPFDRIAGVVHELMVLLVEAGSGHPEGSPAAYIDVVASSQWGHHAEALLAAAHEFRRSARRDLGLNGADDRGVDRPTAVWARPPADVLSHDQSQPTPSE